MVELRFFGTAQLAGSNGRDIDALTRQPKRLALLAYLATAMPQGFQRRDKLVALFWPELDEPHARNALSQALHVIRTALQEEAIVTRGDDEVAIASDLVQSDTWEFAAALDSGHPEAALRLYKGDFLDGLFVSSAPEFERWLDAERTRFRQQASDAAWELAQTEADRGDFREAARHARLAASLVPADETQLRHLMSFFQGLGDRSAAMRVYEEFSLRFSSEYGLEPSAETQELAAKIRQDSRAVNARKPTAPKTAHPGDGAATTPDRGAPTRSPTFRKRWLLRAVPIIAVIIVAGVAAALRVSAYDARTKNGVRVPRLVVLPFQNLGSAENSYFAAGMSDEIATRLAVIQGLNVVSGLAAQRYRLTSPANASNASSKEADYFLSGTASWLPAKAGRGHVRVRLQLVSARDNRELWGAVLDEDIKAAADIFALYSSVAQRVVNELDLVLETQGDNVTASLPTTSLEAYNDYLRGRDYMRRTSTSINFLAAIQNLESAVQRDTNFALAYALLGNAHIEGVWLAGLNRAHLDSAKLADERALRIDPNLPEGHTYLGWYYYVCCEDYGQAMWHLTKSHAMRPGDYQIVMFMGNVHKREGRFAESIAHYQEAVRLDPLARWPRNNLGHAQMWSRHYDDAERTFRQVLKSEPQDIFAYAHLAWLLVLRDGDTKAASRIVDAARRSSDSFNEMRIPYYLALLDRDYDAALASLASSEPGLTASLLNEWLVDDEIRRALIYLLKADSVTARAQFDLARVELEAALRITSPESRRDRLWLRSGLAIVYAGLHRTDEAIAQIEFVTAANPLKVDAIEGPKYLQHVALAHVLLGNRERATDILEQLLSVGAPVSSQSLRLEPFWDPLRNDARFSRLVASAR